MIPPNLPKDCKSPGERVMFYKFKEDPNTKEWVVLHSLGVSDHPTKLESEIDFIAIIPNEGILIIEVKSGKVVTRDQGQWFYGTEKTFKSPFKQASESMHAIRKHVLEKEHSFSKLLFFSCVFFTYQNFNEESPEWHNWQYINRTMFTKFTISKCCLELLKKAHEFVKSKSNAKWYDEIKSRPTVSQTNKLVHILRSNFEYYLVPGSFSKEINREIIKFTEEQYRALDAIVENKRILFNGPAGTGKTFLAIEACRRSLDAQKKTLFICFNNNLGNWLKSQLNEQIENYNDLFTIGTLHSVLLHLSSIKTPVKTNNEFWENSLPENVIEHILRGEVTEEMYDKVIIDEAQDIIKESYLDVIDLLLKGGISGGNWFMFGDFKRQSIYSISGLHDQSYYKDILEQRAIKYVNYQLGINCRNIKPIAKSIELVCNLKPGYVDYLNIDIDTFDEVVDLEYYDDNDHQIRILLSKLISLNKAYNPREIIILSPNRNDRSCSGKLKNFSSDLKLYEYKYPPS